jgi:prepilin-type N-terminal cleavage/methylation domain-containing protein
MKTKAFTLIEILIVVAILSIAVAMATSSFIHILQASLNAQRCSLMHQELRLSLNIMTKDVMMANEIINNGESILGLNVNGKNIFYLIYQNKLYKISQENIKLMANHIKSFKTISRDFNNDSTTDLSKACSVQMRIDGELVSYGHVYTDSVETMARLRNKQIKNYTIIN